MRCQKELIFASSIPFDMRALSLEKTMNTLQAPFDRRHNWNQAREGRQIALDVVVALSVSSMRSWKSAVQIPSLIRET